VWVANAGDRTIVELDPATGERHGGQIGVDLTPSEVAAGEAGVWVVDRTIGRLVRIAPGSREVSATIQTGGMPQAVSTGFGYAWVGFADGTVRRVDPTELAVAGEPIAVGGDPVALAIGKGFVWTADRADGTVTRIDPRATG
jgi:peptide/nickel transport system substrate-binding protein